MRRSGVRAANGGRHGPVIFCDARPEDPDHDDGEQGEEGREEAAVDGAAGAGADVHADNVLEDLADGEEESGDAEVDWGIVSNCVKIRESLEDIRIGRTSPNMRRTRTASRMKKTTMKTSGTSW